MDFPMLSITVAAAFNVLILIGPLELERSRLLQAELSRFPPFQVAKNWSDFGEWHFEWVENETLKHPQVRKKWLGKAFFFRGAWWRLQTAQDPNAPIWLREEALRLL